MIADPQGATRVWHYVAVDVGGISNNSLDDPVVLRTVSGLVDYLLAELDGGRPLRRSERELLVRYEGTWQDLARMRFTTTCALWCADAPLVGVDEVEEAIRRSLEGGLIGHLETQRGQGPLRFRVGDVGPLRWELKARLEDAFGWVNDAGSWVLNFERYDTGVVAEIGPLYHSARAGRLARVPASTNPIVANAIVHLAKISAGAAVLDPFCGSGTLLVAAAKFSPAALIGFDTDARAIGKASQNVRTQGLGAFLGVADARRLPVKDLAIDAVVANLPFGKRVGSHAGNVDLYPRFLRNVARVLVKRGRAVLLTEEKRLLRDSVMRTGGIKIIREVPIETGGLHPSLFVIVRRRG